MSIDLNLLLYFKLYKALGVDIEYVNSILELCHKHIMHFFVLNEKTFFQICTRRRFWEQNYSKSPLNFYCISCMCPLEYVFAEILTCNNVVGPHNMRYITFVGLCRVLSNDALGFSKTCNHLLNMAKFTILLLNIETSTFNKSLTFCSFTPCFVDQSLTLSNHVGARDSEHDWFIR